MKRFKNIIIIVAIAFTSISCSTNNQKETIVTVFHVNDVHGQIKNMAKIKHIVDAQKEKNATVLVSTGDMFSGNPVVDNYSEQGYPMIDIMNHTGFDVAELGNHEFDYGESTLSKRISQANFPWICANADFSNTFITNIPPYQTLQKEDIRITFLGLIETEGMPNAVLPSTHPWDVKHTTFKPAKQVIPNYEHLGKKEGADIYILLSHLGHESDMKDRVGDFEVAHNYPFFDAIIGGHTHSFIDTTINGVGIFQAGSYLNHLGQIDFKIKDDKAEIIHSQLIDLNKYGNENIELTERINSYYKIMDSVLDETIGNSSALHSRQEVGCFFTDALRNEMKADLCIQNTGGIRAQLNKGPITIREIYEIDPFNNGTIMYELTVAQIKKFLKESQSGFYFAGLSISQIGEQVVISNSKGDQLKDNNIIKLCMSDYAAAVHHTFFPKQGKVFNQTSSQMLINHLRKTRKALNYTNCSNYFKFE
jgi:5'-nucleotidase/UDP-sugar diphosphatase